MSFNLFDKQKEPIQLDIPDADIIYYPKFFDYTTSERLFKVLLDSIQWRQDTIKLFGKTHLQPRLTALYADNNKPYTYSNITMKPLLFTKELAYIKSEIEKICDTVFTSCLLNLYRNGQDSNGWHADDEKELGKNPTIASISLGHERWFHLKHKTDKNLKQKILLEHGSLLIMKGKTQECWMHQIPKTKRIIEPRINITYRVIY